MSKVLNLVSSSAWQNIETGSGLDFIRHLAAQKDKGRKEIPYHSLLGIKFREVSAGCVILAAEPNLANLGNGLGIGHGGYAASLVDAAAGFAVFSRAPKGRFNVSSELCVKFRAPVSDKTTHLMVIGTAPGYEPDKERTEVSGKAKIYDQNFKIIAEGHVDQVVFNLDYPAY